MKKTFVTFCTLLLAWPVIAASTCETRVDAHQNASTRERVAYCLTPEAAAPAAAGPELVYYGVSSNTPAADETEPAQPRKQVYFDKDGVAVNQDYVDTKKFPAFTNDTLSEQERLALEEAQKRAAADQAKKAATATAPKRLDTPSVLTEKRMSSKETKAGLLARHKKPNRYLKQAAAEPAVEQQPEPQEPVAQNFETDPYQEDNYGSYPMPSTGTAQAVDENLNAPNNYNAGGAAPQNFTNPALSSDDGFGYNATDPAMQP